ncbi:sialidase family protein [Larkinella rosea]|uniref:Exo-alpha-sialidase n=1 Tax=Larkinella rosea TaxID=2025312 RepID=A0A3P1C2E4_9BACT|nr:sialidase family protein [Larkinella rosea]RRB07580.1 exo-alpha-sialidase [Larkinella rosea]
MISFSFFRSIYTKLLPVLALGLTAAQAQTDLTKTDARRATAGVILEQPVNDPRIKNRQHELVSSIAASADGKQIYLVWYTGGKGEGPGNYVTLAVSLDNGKTWKNDQLVIYPKDSTTRFFDPVLWRDKNEQVWLFYAVSMDNKHWDLKEGVNAIPLSWNGSKVVYEQPRLISYGVMMNKPVYIPQKDMALFPVSVWQLGKDHSQEPGYIPDGTFVHRFDFSKKARRITSVEPYGFVPVLPDSMRTFDEHQVVQTSDKGELLCLVRTKRGIYSSKSNDFGKSWSTLEPFTATGPTTSSRFYIGKLRSGKLLLILNNSKTRNNMTAFLSSDGGKTWPHKLLLDSREKVSYPDMDQTRDGTIHVTFDRDRSGAKDILYTRFREEDVVKGNAPNLVITRVNP